MATVRKQNSRYYPGLFVKHIFLLTLISSIKCIKEPSTFIRHGQSMSQQHYHNAYYRHI